ncbi:hypothetical protein BDN71DRAFT_1394606 [Pleurotus eryngii]|uniref:BTB domain-containing protein n=1 Tax=Pleurotus eryngii TaxID=5323 RepID=A0A9P5ZU95_PLEER|nr:hypothetical protein BDN71DRAFT_1394606 [Pleurotus eryngii]
MSLTDIVSKPLRLLLKIIVNHRGSRTDNISYAVTSKQGAVLQIEQEPPITPLPYPPPSNTNVFDEDYYKSDGNTDGFCLFKVENALFRVHRFVLARDTSAFESMFKIPAPRPKLDDNKTIFDVPVALTDTAEQFRDLLWALYALPNDLHLSEVNGDRDGASSPLAMNRLLNISEMAHKYGFVSFESWALSHIYRQCLEVSGPLHTGSSSLCARILDAALGAGHHGLTELVMDVLAQRLLDFSSPGDFYLPPILAIAEKHGLRRLRGMALYRHIITSERRRKSNSNPLLGLDSSRAPPHAHKCIEDTLGLDRASYLSAYHSLVNVWEHVRSNAPPLENTGCDNHGECLSCWQEVWTQAAQAAEATQPVSADVLNRIQAMNKILRRSLWTHTSIPLTCALAALEGCVNLRDGLIGNLPQLFDEL